MSVSARFTAKQLPEGHLGLRGESWNFGKDNPLSLGELIVTIAIKIAIFYANVVGGDLDELNTDIKWAGEAIARYYLKEEEECQ
jgi:hypothetical protein